MTNTASSAYTFTIPNVTTGERDDRGELTIHTLGDVTVQLVGMSRAEIAEWEWATDTLNTRGIKKETFRLTVNGWKVVHPHAGTVGVLLQGAGSRVHVEWYDAVNGDYFPAGWARNLRHGAASIVNALQRAGHGLPIHVTPEPYTAAAPMAWLEDGTKVRYHGSIADLHDGTFWVRECPCFDCDGYQLMANVPSGGWTPVAIHVGPRSVTARDGTPNPLESLATTRR
ncbi:hypothetical protein [Streptomyces sp. NPDC047315]|uniref:hypothetical protein n=1 Tax=Streptomyces sp. NPDC047315 TaxID=3155142 RepID=UPI0033E4CB8F